MSFTPISVSKPLTPGKLTFDLARGVGLGGVYGGMGVLGAAQVSPGAVDRRGPRAIKRQVLEFEDNTRAGSRKELARFFGCSVGHRLNHDCLVRMYLSIKYTERHRTGWKLCVPKPCRTRSPISWSAPARLRPSKLWAAISSGLSPGAVRIHLGHTRESLGALFSKLEPPVTPHDRDARIRSTVASHEVRLRAALGAS